MRCLFFLVLLATLSLGPAGSPVAAQDITFRQPPVEPGAEPPEVPIEGRPTRVSLPAEADTVRIIWRPSSVLADTLVVPVSSGTFDWTPQQPGVAMVTATSNGEQVASQRVSVRYDGLPGSGIFILIIAGTILFGGAGFALGKLLGDDSTKVDPDNLEYRADT